MLYMIILNISNGTWRFLLDYYIFTMPIKNSRKLKWLCSICKSIREFNPLIFIVIIDISGFCHLMFSGLCVFLLYYIFSIFFCMNVHSHCCTTITSIHLENFFHLSKLKLYSISTKSPFFLSPAPGNHFCTSWLYEFDYFRYLTQVGWYNICPFVTGLFHSVKCLQDSSMLLHVVRISFLSKVMYHSIVCIYHILFIHSSIDGHLDCFYLLAVVNNTAVNMGVQYLSKSLLWFLLSTIPGSEISGSGSNYMFNSLRNCHAIFHSSYTILHSQQQCTRVPIPPHPHQHLLFSDFFKLQFS